MPLSCRAEFSASHLSSVSSHLSVSARRCTDPARGRASFNYGYCYRQRVYVVRLCQDHWNECIGKSANKAAAYFTTFVQNLSVLPVRHLAALQLSRQRTYVPSYVQNLRHLFRQIIGINSSLLPVHVCHYGSASTVKSSSLCRSVNLISVSREWRS